MKRGFTLLEILIVLVLILVISSISFPAFTRMYARSRLGSAARVLQAELNNARLEAMRSGSAYVFRYQGGTGFFEIVPKSVWDAHQPSASELAKARVVESGSFSLTESEPVFSASEAGPTVDNTVSTSGLAGTEAGFYMKELPGGFVFEMPPIVPQTTPGGLDTTRAVGTEFSGSLLPTPATSASTVQREWSAPFFFFPNGRTTNGSFGIISGHPYYYRSGITLRGLTGTARVGSVQSAEPESR